MSAHLTKANRLRRSIETAWAAEEIPQVGQAIYVVLPEDGVAEEYYTGRHWKDVDFSDTRAQGASLGSFTNRGLRYYIAAYLARLLAINGNGQGNFMVPADAAVMQTFEKFFHRADALRRIDGATHDQIGCIVSTAIFMQENEILRPRTLQDHEVEERDQAIERWMQAWRAN
jgi:hypothetical protein